MEKYDWKGDFLGFTFGGQHSSSLGIVRVSDGSRYHEDLMPEFEDKTVKVDGRDDTYYFGSEYKQKNIEVPIAFEDLTEEQLHQLKILMNGSELKTLIFDESPYKFYTVKANGISSLTYVCFDTSYERVYKGEGTLNFIAYFPFAKSRFNYLEDYTPTNVTEWRGFVDNKKDWVKASGIPYGSKSCSAKAEGITIDGTVYKLTTDTITQNLDQFSRNGFISFLVNPGDRPTDIKYSIQKIELDSNESRLHKISLKRVTNNDFSHAEEVAYFKIYLQTLQLGGGIEINSKNLLAMCYDTTADFQNKTNGYIINDKIIQGQIFKIPPSKENEYYYLEMSPLFLKDGNFEQCYGFSEIEEYNYLYY